MVENHPASEEDEPSGSWRWSPHTKLLRRYRACVLKIRWTGRFHSQAFEESRCWLTNTIQIKNYRKPSQKLRTFYWKGTYQQKSSPLMEHSKQRLTKRMGVRALLLWTPHWEDLASLDLRFLWFCGVIAARNPTGDSLRLLLFCLVTLPATTALNSTIKLLYLDDTTVAGNATNVAEDPSTTTETLLRARSGTQLEKMQCIFYRLNNGKAGSKASVVNGRQRTGFPRQRIFFLGFSVIDSQHCH